MPELIQFRNGCQIRNKYDASGRKLETQYVSLVQGVYNPLIPGEIMDGLDVNELDLVTINGTAYIGNMEYTISRYFDWDVTFMPKDLVSLLRMHNTEGFVSNATQTNPNYEPAYSYYRKDHLGNNREVWRATYKWGSTSKPAVTAQRTQYYPSGLPWKSSTADGVALQPYKYGGKEFIETHGLDEYYSYARNVYPAIMRTTTLDPHAESYYSVSPYAWCGNNPVNRVDLNGRDWYEFQNENGSKAVLWQEGNAKTITINEQVYNNIGTTYLAQYDWGAISFNQNEMDGFYPYTSVSDLSISDKGLNFLIDREGLKLNPYNDSKGFATIGVGHLIGKRAVTEQDKKDWAWLDTKQEAMSLLQTDLSGTYEKAVQSLVGVPLMQFQYDAIVSFTFNVGVGGLKQSNFLKELNKGNYNGSLMLNYRRPPEILGRRKKEVNLFNNARY